MLQELYRLHGLLLLKRLSKFANDVECTVMRGSVGAGGGGSRRLPGAPRRDDPQPVDAAVPSAHLTYRTGPNIFRLPAVTWRTNMPWPQHRNGSHLNTYRSAWLLSLGVVGMGLLLTVLTLSQPKVGLALGIATLLWAIGFSRPKSALVVWVLVVCLVPCWFGVAFAGLGYLQPASLLGLPIIAGLLLRRSAVVKFHLADWLVIGYLLALAFATQWGTPSSELKAGFVLFGASYLIGRTIGIVAPERTGKIIAMVAVGLSLFAIMESLTGFHPFKDLNTSSPLGFWAHIQVRGGRDRSEATFGHAIALGSFLALAAPFVLAHLRWRRLGFVIIALGVLATLSRGSMLALGLVVTLTFMPRLGLPALAWRKGGTTLLLGALTLVLYPITEGVALQSSAELDSTANYRSSLLSLIHLAHPFGLAEGTQYRESIHTFIFGGYFGSIDNAPLALALTQGWLPLLPLLVGVAGAVFVYLRGQAGPAHIALLGQIPALITVALITQWGPLVWLIAGWAVSEAATMRRAATRGMDAAEGSSPHWSLNVAESSSRPKFRDLEPTLPA